MLVRVATNEIVVEDNKLDNSKVPVLVLRVCWWTSSRPSVGQRPALLTRLHGLLVVALHLEQDFGKRHQLDGRLLDTVGRFESITWTVQWVVLSLVCRRRVAFWRTSSWSTLEPTARCTATALRSSVSDHTCRPWTPATPSRRSSSRRNSRYSMPLGTPGTQKTNDQG